MSDRRFRNGDRIIHLSPGVGWTISEVTGEDREGGAYTASGRVDARDIAGAVSALTDEAALIEAMEAAREKRQTAVADARKAAWDAYWDALETAAVQRVPGILPTF